jgi:K+-sensing histidine kinase KdpD
MKKRETKAEEQKRKKYYFTYFFALLNLLILIFIFFEKFSDNVSTGLFLALGILALLVWNSKRTLVVFIIGIGVGLFLYIFSIPMWTAIFFGNVVAFIYQKSREFREGKIY